MSPSDEFWMHWALELAERGRGSVEPNPLVGAVVVREGQLVGEGWHQRFGEAHAEVHALSAAGDAARGATLYVTLEPCCHLGKTPPCTEAIVRAGVSHVVAAMRDPFPQVAGQGEAQLRSAGITVDVGLCEPEARKLNAPYLKLLATGQPYVHAKWAMSLDGKIATRSGESRWISNEASRRRVHNLRGRMDAIVIGVGTAVADDPLLTARPPGSRTAVRIVIDPSARLPLASQLVRTAAATPVMVATSDLTPPERIQALTEHGCECLPFSMVGGHFLDALLRELGKRRMTNILVEGGSKALGSFFDEQLVDEVHAFIAPVFIGGREAPAPLGGRGAASIAAALRLADWKVEVLDGDVYLQGQLAARR